MVENGKATVIRRLGLITAALGTEAMTCMGGKVCRGVSGEVAEHADAHILVITKCG